VDLVATLLHCSYSLQLVLKRRSCVWDFELSSLFVCMYVCMYVCTYVYTHVRVSVRNLKLPTFVTFLCAQRMSKYVYCLLLQVTEVKSCL
jgi:hypothetical protein